MKQITLFLLLIAPFFAFCQVSKDEYNGKLGGYIAITNPFISSHKHCIDSIYINENKYIGHINKYAFLIDYDSAHVSLGDSVCVEIFRHNDCKAKVIYGQDSIYKKVQFISQEISPEGILKWTAKNEPIDSRFQIQQYKWHKWITVGEIKGKGSEGENSYMFNLTQLTSRINEFRIIQKGMHEIVIKSPTIELFCRKKEVIWKYNKLEKKIIFSEETGFEIFTIFGELILTGYAKQIDYSQLKPGKYYMNYDRDLTEFIVPEN